MGNRRGTIKLLTMSYLHTRNTNSRPLNHTINLEAPKVGTKIDSHYDINVNQPAIGVDLLSVLFASSAVAVILLLAMVFFIGFKYKKLKDLKEEEDVGEKPTSRKHSEATSHKSPRKFSGV